jgi:hypothetical protein
MPLHVGPQSGARDVLGAGQRMVARGRQKVRQEGCFRGHAGWIALLQWWHVGMPRAPQVIILLDDIHRVAL